MESFIPLKQGYFIEDSTKSQLKQVKSRFAIAITKKKGLIQIENMCNFFQDTLSLDAFQDDCFITFL